MNEYKITLTNGGAYLLRHLLNQPGWTDKISDFITAAKLLSEVVPEVEESPERPIPTADDYFTRLSVWKVLHDSWLEANVPEFSVNEKQRDNVKACLKHAVDKKVIPPSPAAYELFTAFGVTE